VTLPLGLAVVGFAKDQRDGLNAEGILLETGGGYDSTFGAIDQ
jgi:hypothetical protein